MIVKISGQLVEKKTGSVVVDTPSGLAYQVFVTTTTLDQLKETDICLYIYHHIREDAQQLFGFLSLNERNGFVTLTSVSGMGPKAAMKVLSACSWDQLQLSITSENLVQLVSLPGIGKKLAERLVTELRDKLNDENLQLPPQGYGHRPTAQQDLMLALKSLGYQNQEIKHALQKTGSQLMDNTVEKNIKLVLQHLNT